MRKFFIFLKTKIKNRYLAILILVAICHQVLFNNWFLYGDIFRLRIPEVERWQAGQKNNGSREFSGSQSVGFT